MKKPILPTLLMAVLWSLFATPGTSQSPVTLTLEGDKLRESLNFMGNAQAVQVCGLKVGKTYQAWTMKAGCQPTVKLAGSTAPPTKTFEFLATSACMDIALSKSASQGECLKGPVWFSVACNDCNKKSADPFSKIGVMGGQSAQTLVQNIFVGGVCYDISGFTTIGASLGRGSFDDGASTIGLDNGVILSTGDVSFAVGSNNDDGAGINIGGPNSDPDLDILTGGLDLYDVQGLEFDFVPTSSNVSFQYVFASEEYCEYVNQGVSDFFGFFISGPGINGGFTSNGENIALVPNSSMYVSIDNVSHLTNSTYFVPNRPNCGGTTNMSDIQFDGWTATLSAMATVVPCEKYHIRLVIADVGDGIFDSAIFLGGGSFSAGGNAGQGEIVTPPGPFITYESCDDGTFRFARADGNTSQPLSLDFIVLPTSTATSGVDYDPFPLTVVIPAGEINGSLPINVIADGIAEGVETIHLRLANACTCDNQEFTLEIHDPPAVQVTLPVVEACEGSAAQIQATASGGIPGTAYTYAWSNSQTGPTASISPATNQTISVTVTDDCGTTATASTDVQVLEVPSATLASGGGNVCLAAATDLHTMVIEFTGAPNWLLDYTINGIAQTPVLVTASPYELMTSTVGTYELTGVTSVANNCPGTASGHATINLGDLESLVQTIPITCTTASSMTLTTTGGTAPYSYDWGNGLPDAPSAVSLPPGIYSVTVTDMNGCSTIASGNIIEIPALTASAVGSVVDCFNPSGGSVSLTLNGGASPFDFEWSNGLPNQQDQTGLGTGDYAVTVSDANGCTASATASIVSSGVAPLAAAQANGLIDCNAQTVEVTGQGSAVGTGIAYLWSGPGILGANNTLDIEVDETGAYELLVTNSMNGCTTTASVQVDADLNAPTAFAEGDTITCTNSIVAINGNGSSTGPNILYEWLGAGIVTGGNTLTPAVEEAGTYTLLVTNQTNGCTASAVAEVASDEALPVANIAPPDQLNCSISSVILDGAGSSTGPTFTYQWFQNGGAVPNVTAPTLNVSSVGDYQLVVTDAENGCTSSFTMPVDGDFAPPSTAAEADGQLNCTVSEVALSANVQGNPTDFSFAWSTQNGNILGVANTPDALADSPGDYEVVVTNLINGCSDSATVQLTQNIALPSVEVTTSNNLDCNDLQAQLNGSGSSQGPTITFNWTTPDGNFSAGQNSLTPTIDAGGTYFLTLFDTSNNCEAQDSVAVTVDNAYPTVLIAPPPTLDCGTTQAVLNAAVSNVPPNADLTYTWSSQDGLFIGPTDLPTPTVGGPGTYTLWVMDNQNGCANQASTLVEEDVETPVAVIAPPDQLTCLSDTVALNATGSSVGTAFEYHWTTATGAFTTSYTVLNPGVNEPGTYILLITNALNGCTATQQIVVEEDIELPDAIANPSAILDCSTTSLNLSGSGSSSGPDFEYLWTGPSIAEGETSLVPLVDEPGIYQLLVTNVSTGCASTTSVSVGENVTPPVAEAGTAGEFACGTVSMNLDGAGSSLGVNFMYEWTSPNGNILSGENSLTPTVNTPGDYLLLVSDTSNGCVAADTVQIIADEDLPPIAIAQAPSFTCIVEEVTLDGTGSATGPDISYNWITPNGQVSAGGTTLNPVVTEPGTYILTVTDNAANCSNTASIIVGEQTALPVAEAGQADQLNCLTTTVSLNGNGSTTGTGFSYLWTTTDGNILSGETTLNPSVDEPGNYSLLVTDDLTGCTNTDQVVVAEVIDPPLAAASTPDVLDCNINSLNLSGTGSAVGGTITYAWSTPDGNIMSGANTLSPLVDEPGTYTLTVTNGTNNCTQTATTTVVQDVASPVAEAGTGSQLNCTETTLTLDGAGSSVGNNFNYQWSTSNGNIVSGGSTLSPVIDEPGTYLLTITNNVNGCSADDAVVINQDVQAPLASIAPPDLLTCEVHELTLVATAPLGSNFSYLWTTVSGNIVSGETTLTPTVNQTGAYTLHVLNELNGCTTAVETMVAQDIQVPTADAGNPFLLNCSEAYDYLDGSNSFGNGPLSFQWTTTNGEMITGDATATPAVISPGTYQLTVTDVANGCTHTDEVTVSSEAPTATPAVVQPPCFGDNGSISISDVAGGQAPYTYSIDGGTSFTSQANYPNLEPGIYPLVVQDANGCSLEVTVEIEAPALFEIQLAPQITLQLGDSVQINVQTNVPSNEIGSVQWFPGTYLSCTGCLNPVATPFNTLAYTVTVVNNDGCEASAPLLLLVEKSTAVYVPNAFSPNEDGINDVFMIYSDPKYPVHINKFMVFSRWGESVFEQFDFQPNDPAHGWDGLHRAQAMDPAVFAWFAEVEFLDGSTRILKGDVTLVK